jgi:cytochrome c
MISIRYSIAAAALLAAAPALSQVAAPRQFGICGACHKVTADAKGLGPTLFRVTNRPAASVPGFAYSPALKGSKIKWTRAELTAFITAPQSRVPGTRMAYAGQKDPAAVKAIVDYLATLK